MQFNAYIYFNGDCEAAFQLYERALGAKIEKLERFGDAPRNPPPPASWAAKIIRGHIRIGDAVILASDAPPGMYTKPHGTRLSITARSLGEAQQAFAALAEGGFVHLPFQQTGLSTYFGMLADRYGMPWMINCETAN